MHYFRHVIINKLLTLRITREFGQHSKELEATLHQYNLNYPG